MSEKQNLYPSLEELTIDQSLSSDGNACGLSIYPQLTMESNDENNELVLADPILKYITLFKEKTAENYQKASVKEGLREVVLCKNQQGKIGLSFQIIDMGLFVSLVEKESAGALAGVRFGEQLIAINGQAVSGIKKSKIEKMIKEIPLDGEIRMIFRDRPYAKIFNLTKDQSGLFGFTFKKGNITNIIKDTSGAKNGLQIDHQIVEVNGQNVLGFTDGELKTLFRSQENVITITVMEHTFYKKMASKVDFENMSHILPEF